MHTLTTLCNFSCGLATANGYIMVALVTSGAGIILPPSFRYQCFWYFRLYAQVVTEDKGMPCCPACAFRYPSELYLGAVPPIVHGLFYKIGFISFTGNRSGDVTFHFLFLRIRSVVYCLSVIIEYHILFYLSTTFYIFLYSFCTYGFPSHSNDFTLPYSYGQSSS